MSIGGTINSGGNFVEVRPYTAATNIEFSAAADAAGFLRLSSAELGNFTTPLLKVGNSAVSGSIAVNEPVAPAFSSLSLITSGAITQTGGSTITIANLNADGWGGVTLSEPNNNVTNLSGHTNASNFSFTDVDLLNVGQVDGINGINSGGSITLIAGSTVTQSNNAILAASGSLTVNAANGINLANANNNAPTVNLINGTSGNVAYKASTPALAITATTVGAGSIAITNTGGTLNVTNAATGSGSIALTGSGNVTLATVTTSGQASVTSSAGAITDNNAGTMNITAASISLTAATGIATVADPLDVSVTGVATLTAQTTSGDIYLASPGNMPISLIKAPGTVSLASSTGSIIDSDNALTNIIANTAILSAYSGIGMADPIEMQVAYLSAINTMSGDIGLVNNASLLDVGSLSNVGGVMKVQTTGDIRLNNAISSSVSGDAIVLAAGGGFINSTGAGVESITASSGRWLVYTAAPATTTKNGLAPSFYQYGTAYGGTVPPNGNGFIYASPLYVDANFSGTLSSVFGAEPTAVPGYTLNGLDANDTGTTITGTATYTNWPVTATTAAGSYSLQYASGLTASPYYTLTPGVAQTYTVNPAVLALITAALTGTASKTYDGTDVATLEPGNFLLSGFVGSDSATVTKTTGTYASVNAGSDIKVSTTLAASDFSPVGSTVLTNYTLPTTASGNIGVITPAPLSVKANDLARVYDSTSFSGGNGVSYIGFVAGETEAVLSGALTYTGTSQGAIDAGSYVITPGGLSSGNYTIGYVDGALTITPAVLALAGASVSKAYGDPLTFSGAEFTPTGLLGGDTIGSVTLTSPGAVDTANAGVYPITPSNAVFSVGNAGNYAISYVDGQLTVNPALLTVTADALSKAVGNPDPLLTYTTAGLKFTDTAAAVLSGALARLAGETAGVYPINQGTLASLSANYSINYVPADFSIVAASSTVMDNLVNDIVVAPPDVRFEPPAPAPAEGAAAPAGETADNGKKKKDDEAAAAVEGAAPAAQTATATAALPVCK